MSDGTYKAICIGCERSYPVEKDEIKEPWEYEESQQDRIGPTGQRFLLYTWEEVQPDAPKWKETLFDVRVAAEWGYEPNEDLTATGKLTKEWNGFPAGSTIILDIERGWLGEPHPLGDFVVII